MVRNYIFIQDAYVNQYIGEENGYGAVYAGAATFFFLEAFLTTSSE